MFQPSRREVGSFCGSNDVCPSTWKWSQSPRRSPRCLAAAGEPTVFFNWRLEKCARKGQEAVMSTNFECTPKPSAGACISAGVLGGCCWVLFGLADGGQCDEHEEP